MPPPLPPLIAALLRPQSYPHPVNEVELLQTHLSWVLLAGEYAYKIKKQVKFDFVDFSTLARRRQACLDELRLNQRFAPALYIDVVAISGSESNPHLHSGADGFEYAVRLRRFEQRDLLSALLDRGEVTDAQLERFGDGLAELHEAGPVCSREGAAARGLDAAAENLAELARAEHAPPLEDLIAWTDAQRVQRSELVRRRGDHGRVRECHGDLHAGNIVRHQSELTAFDCIEFSERLRCIDVMSDAAFLVMDLVARDARPLAYAFLNGWLERGGDYEAVALLPFFAAYRAIVRAKVARLAGDGATSDRYLRTARGFAGRRAPTLIVMCGLSGSGKTWVSRRLMIEAGAVRVRSDVERKRLAGLAPLASSASIPGFYSLAMNQRVYDLLLRHARTVLSVGENAVIDAAFLRRGEREMFFDAARELGARSFIVHCTAPTEELERRLTDRAHSGRDASEATVAVLDLQRTAFESFTQTESSHVLTVSATEPDSLSRALRTVGV